MDKQLTGNDRPLHLAKENDKTVLASSIGGVDITIFFAEEEPARNAKEACLSIIGRRYSSKEVVPITGETRKKSYQPTHIPVRYDGLSMHSVALLEQLRTLDKSRLKSCVGELDAETMKRIETALLISVGMKEESHGG